MGKIFMIFLFVHSAILLSGQASGGWGICEFATVASMNAFDPSGSNSSCKKAFVQATNEYYRWNGVFWILERVDVENIYTVDKTLLGDRILNMGSFDLNFINGDTFILDVNVEVRTGNIRFSEYGQGNKSGTEVFSLGVDANGNVIEIPLGSGSGDNIYNSDGTLLSNRTINGNSRNLTITGLNSFSLSAITTTIGSTANVLYEADQNGNGTGDHKFFNGGNEHMRIENAGTIDLLEYGGGIQEDNQNNAFNLAVDGNGNVLEVDSRVLKMDATTYTSSGNLHNVILPNLTTSPYYEVYRIYPPSNIQLTGISSIDVKNGQKVTILNVSPNRRIRLRSENTNSSPVNRFILPNDADINVRYGGTVTFMYDAISSRWRVYAVAY